MARIITEPTYKRFISGQIRRFDADNTAYSRAGRGELPSVGKALADGFNAKAARNGRPNYQWWEDYALLLAGRAIDSLCRRVALGRPDMARRWALPQQRMPVGDPGAITNKIKRVAKWFGADLVGICSVNPLWIYSHWGTHSAELAGDIGPRDPIDLPEEIKYAVVMAFEMDYHDIQRSPALCPSVDLGYSRQAYTATFLAEFIRGLGWQAIPAGNDFALSIPLAVDAGLGELGRNGMLITEPYGPRVRLSKVFTDLPLVADKPIDIGVQHFCETCGKCAKRCPGQAIPQGERTDQPVNISTSPGILKWPLDSERCLNWWYKNGGPCTNCIRVCSYNKPKGVIHKMVRGVLARTSLLDQIMLWADDLFGYGTQILRETPDPETYTPKQ